MSDGGCAPAAGRGGARAAPISRGEERRARGSLAMRLAGGSEAFSHVATGCARRAVHYHKESVMQDMAAIVMTKYGGPEGLREQRVPIPEAVSRNVVARARPFGLNQAQPHSAD